MTAQNFNYIIFSKSSVIIGSLSLIIFFHFVLLGHSNIVQLNFGVLQSYVFDFILTSVYFIQHSLMIRQKIRNKIENYLPKETFYSFHSIVSGAILGIVITLWQQVDFTIYTVPYPLRFAFYALTIISIIGLIWAIISLSSFDPFGRKQIKNYIENKGTAYQQFIVRGPYRYTRHPFYFFILAMIWLHPIMTVDRLLFATLWTCWVIIGTRLEEKDLVADIGEDYVQYQSRVPMLVPYKLFNNIKG